MSALKMLDPVHHAGIRLASGAFRTSPIHSLYVEANEFSLEKRRATLSLMHSLRICSVPEHPSREAIERPRFEKTFENKRNTIPPLSIRK